MARLLGKEHPNTLTSMNNLAQTLYAQGDLAGARKLQEQVLEARARLLGKEHPNTLTSMNNLAQTLYAQGDLAGARKLRCCKRKEILPGPSASTAWRSNVANACRRDESPNHR